MTTADSPLDTLPLPRTNCPVATPWGPAYDAIVHAGGIVSYHTASHGGICLTAARFADMPTPLRAGTAHLVAPSGRAWFEEDCNWCIPVLAFPEAFLAEQVTQAEVTLRHWHPNTWEDFYGRVLSESESLQKRRQIFHDRHRNDLLGVCAWGGQVGGVPAGKVGVLAVPGGDRQSPNKSYWLVDTVEYDARPSDVDFVINPARHLRVTGPFGSPKRPA